MITQGKWHNVCDSGSHKVDIMTDEGTYICTCAGTKNGLDISCEEDEANARLIAAAPELLAACENIAWTANKVANGGLKQPDKREKIGDVKQAIRDLRDTANAAIKVAKGVK